MLQSSSVADYEYINLRESMAQLNCDALQRTVLVAQEKNVSSVETSMETVTLNLDLLAPGITPNPSLHPNPHPAPYDIYI